MTCGHAAGDGTTAAIVAPPPLRCCGRCGPSLAALGSYCGGAGGVVAECGCTGRAVAVEEAAEAEAAEAAAARRSELWRPETACCRAAGDRTAAAVVVPLLPCFCRICRRRRRAAAVATDAGVVLP